MNTLNSTLFPQENPKSDDKFTRLQILQYLEEIPLNYTSARDHEITEELILRAQRHFALLDVDWQPSDD